jgi:hypothetical protein
VIFPLAEFLTGSAVGALDGWAASSDQSAGRTSLTNERSMWVKVGAFLGGAALDFAGWNEAITETLMATSLALIFRQLAFRFAQGSTGVPAQGYAAYVQPAGFAHGYAPAASGPTLALPTSAGYSRGLRGMTSVGAVG